MLPEKNKKRKEKKGDYYNPPPNEETWVTEIEIPVEKLFVCLCSSSIISPSLV